MIEPSEILKSRLLPEAFHDSNSSFFAIYCKDKDSHKFVLMLEKCTDSGFMYVEYYAYGEKAGYIEMIQKAGYLRESNLPSRRHEELTFLKRLAELKDLGYVEEFSGEIPTKELDRILAMPIELTGAEKLTIYDVIMPLKSRLHINFVMKKEDKGIFSSATAPQKTYSEKVDFALKQLSAGICTEGNKVDLTGSQNQPGNGIIGNGCIKALAAILASGKCRDLYNLTIDLSGNIISESGKLALIDAINSRNCPFGLTLQGIPDPGFKKLLEQYNLLISLAAFMQLIKEKSIELPLDVLNLIACEAGIRTFKDSAGAYIINRQQTIENISNDKDERYLPRITHAAQWEKQEKELISIIPRAVSTNLECPFTFSKQAWVLISPDLQQTITNQVHAALSEILAACSHTQQMIIMENMENDLLAKIIGKFEKGQSFDVTTGKGISMSGITKIYFDAISTRVAKLGFSMLIEGDNQERSSASHDELKISMVELKERISLFIFNLLAEHASLAQINVLNEDCKDKDSPSMKLLRKERPAPFPGLFNPQVDSYGDTRNYKSYCNMLTAQKAEKDVAEKADVPKM